MTYDNVYGLEASGVEEISPTVPSFVTSFDELTKILTWTRGDGERSMVIASIENTPLVPLDGVTYQGLISNGVIMVYKGVETSLDLTGLLDFNVSPRWYIFIYEFNGVQSTEKYLRKRFGSVNFIVYVTEDGDTYIKEDDSGGFSPENNP